MIKVRTHQDRGIFAFSVSCAPYLLCERLQIYKQFKYKQMEIRKTTKNLGDLIIKPVEKQLADKLEK